MTGRRGLIAHVLGGKFTLYLALDPAAEANKAVKPMWRRLPRAT